MQLSSKDKSHVYFGCYDPFGTLIASFIILKGEISNNIYFSNQNIVKENGFKVVSILAKLDSI